jgi:hypothetical protein
MQNIQEKQLMEKFLKLNYPVNRTKHNNRFKRTIILDSKEIYFLGDKHRTKDLYYSLLNVLKVVFSPDEPTSRDVLKNFLHLKTQL